MDIHQQERCLMKNPWNKIRSKIKHLWGKAKQPWPGKPVTRDHIDLRLWGLNLSVSRETTSEVPSELTVVVPRAEFRTGCETGDSGRCNTELILNSITVVIAPRHPTEHGSASPNATYPKLISQTHPAGNDLVQHTGHRQ